MARVIIDPGQVADRRVVLNRDEVKHLKNVLRLREGDEVEALDGTGRVYRARIETIGRFQGTLLLLDKKTISVGDNTRLVFCQALTKGGKMDYLVQKATELGVASFYVFSSSRSVPQLESSRSALRLRRWEKIAREACKQCGRNVFPEIRGIMDFHEVVRAGRDCPTKLIFWEEERTTSVSSIAAAGGIPAPICCLVGPEGGFSASEIMEARSEGFTPVSLGERTLRAETAALAVLIILQFSLGELG